MNLEKLMKQYRAILDTELERPYPVLIDHVKHLQWMTTQIPTMTHAIKQARWIGFVQGSMWFAGLRSIDEMRQDVRELERSLSIPASEL